MKALGLSLYSFLIMGISPPQGRYLHTGQCKYIINADPCLEWDSNPRSQRSSEWRQFMPQTARPLWSALRDCHPSKIHSLVCLLISRKLKFVVSSVSSLQETNSEQKTKIVQLLSFPLTEKLILYTPCSKRARNRGVTFWRMSYSYSFDHKRSFGTSTLHQKLPLLLGTE
jgi:hypothetical protein